MNGGYVYTFDKHTGRYDGRREATKAEMLELSQMLIDQEKERVKEESEKTAEAIKEASKKYETTKIDNKKYEEKVASKKLEMRIANLKKTVVKEKVIEPIAIQFNYDIAKSDKNTLTIAEVILGKQRESNLKKQS